MIVIRIIVFVILIISISSIKVYLDFVQENRDNQVIIKVKMLYGLIRLKKELDKIEFAKKEEEIDGKVENELEVEVNSESDSNQKEKKDFINVRRQIDKSTEMLKKYRNVINYLISRINFKDIYWRTEIGFGDAALTGMSIGIINILKGNVYAILHNIKIKPKKIYFKVVPNFNREILKTDIHSIFKVKIGYIIIAGLKYFWISRREN